MSPRNQIGKTTAASGCAHAEQHAEVVATLEALKDRGLDQSAVAFHLRLEHSTIHRWYHGDVKDLSHAVTMLRIFSALMKTCPEAARAARVDSPESWAKLLSGLRQTHTAAWVGSGFRDILDGADADEDEPRRAGAR